MRLIADYTLGLAIVLTHLVLIAVRGEHASFFEPPQRIQLVR
jgi:hypothetical protein